MNLAEVRAACGGTFYPIGLETMDSHSGYLVSYSCFAWRFSDDLTIEQVLGYCASRREALEVPESFLGVWFNDGFWYLDVSRQFTDLEEALLEAKQQEQLAIWDCQNKTEVFL